MLDWPQTGHINEILLSDMTKVREAINYGLAQRAKERIKVRQPLSKVVVYGMTDIRQELVDIIGEELNVKQVVIVPRHELKGDETFTDVVEVGKTTYNLLDIMVEIDVELTKDLKAEGLMREVIRQVQSARKQADLHVDDRIKLDISTEDTEISGAIEQFKKEISDETLAVSLTIGSDHTYLHLTTTDIEKSKIVIAIDKAE